MNICGYGLKKYRVNSCNTLTSNFREVASFLTMHFGYPPVYLNQCWQK